MGSKSSTPDSPDVYIRKDALRAILKQSRNAAPKETIGFMVGHVRRCNEKACAVVERAITSDDDSTETSAKFKTESLGKIAAGIGDGEIIVGWYHSHPGYGCFMSDRDIKTQTESFLEDYHTALVVDPVENKIAFYRVQGGRCREVSYKSYGDESCRDGRRQV